MPQERSFKSYISDRFYNELYAGKQFIKGSSHPCERELKLHRVMNIDGIDLSDTRVVFVDVLDWPGSVFLLYG